MLKKISMLAALCLIPLGGVAAQGQFYKIHNADIAGSGVGQFTTVLTNNTSVVPLTTTSFGGLFSLREHPFAWAGVEFNYSFNKYSEEFASLTPGVNTANYYSKFSTNAHEATAAYMFHPHFRKLQPFVNIGGGAIDFIPINGANQWRGAGLLEVGFDLPTHNPHFGFRVQGRTLVYRTPNYYNQFLATKSWVSTEEPTFGVYYRR